MKRRQKGILAVILVLLVGAGIFAYHHHEEAAKQAAARELTLSGNVDVREVTLSFRGSDRVKDILVEEGDTVEEGQVLARLDTDELNINLRKTKAQIAAQQSTVAKLHNGTRAEEIAQAQQRYKAAEAAASNAQGIYERRQAVYDSVEGVSEQDLATPAHRLKPSRRSLRRPRRPCARLETARAQRISRRLRPICRHWKKSSRAKSICSRSTSCAPR